MTSAVVVLNYNGKTMLPELLSSLTQAAQSSRHQCDLYLLDNCSVDGSVEWTRKNYPNVNLIEAPENKVLCSYNEAVKQLSQDIVILLNNDLTVDRDFIDPIISVFEDYPDAFFASFYSDHSLAKLRFGVLGADITFKGYEDSLDHFGYTLNTGMGAFHRLRFLELAGYDELYLPGRYEDVDLCYRGWKKGWKGYYQPKSRIQHLGGASFNKYFSAKENETLVFRNSIFFMLKNMTDFFLIGNFILFLLVRLIGFALRGRWHMFRGFSQALRGWGKMRLSRKLASKNFLLNDWEVISRINAKIIASTPAKREEISHAPQQ